MTTPLEIMVDVIDRLVDAEEDAEETTAILRRTSSISVNSIRIALRTTYIRKTIMQAVKVSSWYRTKPGNLCSPEWLEPVMKAVWSDVRRSIV